METFCFSDRSVANLFNSQSTDDNFGSGATSGAGYGNKSNADRDTFDDSSNTRFGSSTDTGAYSGSNEFGSGTTGGAGYGNKSTSGRDEFNDSSDSTRFRSSGETGAYSGSNEYGSGTTTGAGYGNKSASHTTDEHSGKKSGKLLTPNPLVMGCMLICSLQIRLPES